MGTFLNIVIKSVACNYACILFLILVKIRCEYGFFKIRLYQTLFARSVIHSGIICGNRFCGRIEVELRLKSSGTLWEVEYLKVHVLLLWLEKGRYCHAEANYRSFTTYRYGYF